MKSLLVLPFLIFLSSCQKDDSSSVRVPKETTPAMTAPAVGGSAEASGLQWTVPTGWVEQPASMMRVGSFIAAGKNGMKADISVVPLSGDAGGNLANINRWRGQINLSPITEKELKTATEMIAPAGRSMLFVDFLSDDLLIDNRFKKRLMAAVYKQAGTTWFFKATGEDSAVRDVKPAFLKFLESLKFSNS